MVNKVYSTAKTTPFKAIKNKFIILLHQKDAKSCIHSF